MSREATMRAAAPSKDPTSVFLGFEVGTGTPVEVPLAHTFVTGQTQLSGKTTTLRALVERSGRRALAFVTKRGEDFAGRRLCPYLPREGDRPLHWRLVETLMAAALGQRNMKWERGAIVTATKGATTLADVRRNVSRLHDKTKNPKTEELYMLLGEYLDLVLPELEALHAAPTLDLAPGLNVMDLADVAAQTQAWVIRAALEHVNRHETGVLTVFPEAWEFAPRGRGGPAKDEAIAMARKGAVLGNYLLCDSQDLAGVDTVVRQAASVWILGVQRELNELRRTIQMIPAGIKRPKPEDVATLALGQFYACWSRHAIKTYVQPTWMPDGLAHQVAVGVLDVQHAAQIAAGASVRQAVRTLVVEDESVTKDEAAQLERENRELRTENADLRRRLEALEQGQHENQGRRQVRTVQQSTDDVSVVRSHGPGADMASVSPGRAQNGQLDEGLYQAIKARLLAELPEDPAILELTVARPELRVERTRHTITVNGETLRGRIAQLVADGFFDEAKTTGTVSAELSRRGFSNAASNVSRELGELAKMGFLTISNKWWRGVPDAKVHVVEK